MITQYTRLYLDGSGNIKHCLSQTLPFIDGYDPVSDDAVAQVIDLEIDTDFEESEGMKSQKILRAREIINSLEVKGGKPLIKNPHPKIMGSPRKKPVNESSVKSEITKTLEAVGISSADFAKAGKNINKLSDLSPSALIRAKNALLKNSAQGGISYGN